MVTAGHKAKSGLTIAATLVPFAFVSATSAIVLSPLNLAPGIVPPKAGAYAVEAERAAARGDVAGALQQTRAEAQVSPMRGDAWLRVAELDARLNGRLTQTGLSACRTPSMWRPTISLWTGSGSALSVLITTSFQQIFVRRSIRNARPYPVEAASALCGRAEKCSIARP